MIVDEKTIRKAERVFQKRYCGNGCGLAMKHYKIEEECCRMDVVTAKRILKDKRLSF